MSTSESWGVNGHIRGLVISAGVRGDKETEISADPWALEARERTLLFYFFLLHTCLKRRNYTSDYRCGLLNSSNDHFGTNHFGTCTTSVH